MLQLKQKQQLSIIQVLITCLLLAFFLNISKVKAAIEFDGVNDSVSFSSAGMDFSANQATLSMWIKIKNAIPATSKTGFVHFGNAENSHYPWTDGLGYFDVFRTSRVDAVALSPSIDRTQWHLVTILTNPGTNGWQLYQNTTLVKSVTGQASVSIPATLRLGKSSGPRFIEGSIDDFRLYNRVLSPTEIDILYNSRRKRIAGSLANGLVAHFEMDGNEIGSTVGTVNDVSGNSYHGTGNGGASLKYTEGILRR